jgi:ABC-2 type transport system permease protein
MEADMKRENAQTLFRAYTRFFAASFRANLRSAMEYRTNFLVQVFGMMINNAAFVVFWSFLFAKTGALGGYRFQDVMFLWALSSSAFGLSNVLFGNARQLSELVRQGDLDVYLLQPKDVLINALTSKTIVSAWGDFAYGFVVLAFLGFDPPHWIMFALFVVSGALVFTGVFVISESLSFFLGSSAGITGAATEFILSFSLYPVGIFPSGMRWVFYSLVPSGFIVFLPLRVFRSWSPGLAALVLAVSVAYAFLAAGIFRAGLKRYESGNRIGARD